MISAGWKVYAADGSRVRRRWPRSAGDEDADIFDGLEVATSAVARPKYVPAENVTTITEGRIDTSLTQDEVEGGASSG